jgi:hypothetical protein
MLFYRIRSVQSAVFVVYRDARYASVNGLASVSQSGMCRFTNRNNKDTNEVINVCNFFSGHYKRLGINVQAVSDECLHFLCAGVAMPGSQPDCSAYAVTSLKKKVD